MATERPRRGSERDADELGAEDRIRNDDEERDFGEGSPPDPLGQAMPEVTEAHLAEAGVEIPSPSLRKSKASNGVERVEREHAEPPAGKRKSVFGRAVDFLKASAAELRRVQWPDRRQVGQGTAVTIGFVIVAGAYLGLLDAIWNPVIQAIL
jgi:preprotein translocase SecE subunit